MYDATSPETFERTDAWVNEIRSKLGDAIPIMIAANKMDLTELVNEEIIEKGKEFALETGAELMQVSAKTNQNVTHLFTELAISKYNHVKVV